MVNKKFIAISYCCIFFFIYLSSIAYALIPSYLNKFADTNINLPTTQAMNATMSGLSGLNSFSSWTGIIIIMVVACFILIYFSQYSMKCAYG